MSSGADEGTGTGLALPLVEIETLLTETARVILPLQAVLEVTFAVHILVVISTGATVLVLIFLAAINHTGTALELVVRKALHTHSSIIPEAALLHLLTGTIFCQVIPTLTGNASEVIVTFALLDGALVVLELEGLVTLRTGVVRLLHLAA